MYGMLDIGVSCQKDSYGRGVGIPLTCKTDEQYDAGLCYPYCNASFDGVGPVCWAECPSDMYDCGALCTATSDKCSSSVKDIVTDVVAVAVVIAEAITGDIDIMKIVEDIGKIAIDLASGLCEVPTPT